MKEPVKHKDLFDSAFDMIVCVDRDGNILDINKAAERLTGYTQSKLKKMNVYKDLLVSEDIQMMKAVIKQLVKNIDQMFTVRWTAKNGKIIKLEGTSTACLDDQGKFICTRCFLRDVTEREKVLAELTKSEQKFKQVVENANDATSIELGKYNVLIIEDKDECEEKCEEQCEEKDCKHKCCGSCDDFEIHWSGIDIGVNGLMTPSNSTSAPEGYDFLELDYGKSFSIGLNVIEQNIRLYKNHVTIVTGLGIEFNHYAFKNNTSLQSNNDSIWGYEETEINFKKNKLRTVMLEAPLMLGFSTNDNPKKSFHLAAGIVFGYKLGAKTKQKYNLEGDKYKPKVKGDFNIQSFRYSATVRMGYGNFSLFADYALSPMFEKNRGPELYPFSVGFTLKDL